MTAPRRWLAEADEREVAALIARYGHLVDDRDFAALTEVFTEDASITWVDGEAVRTVTFVQLRGLLVDADHPSAHHCSNLVCEPAEEGAIRARSKGLAIEPDGRSWSVVYDDHLVRTPAGWRVRRRVVHERPSTARSTRHATDDPITRGAHAGNS